MSKRTHKRDLHVKTDPQKRSPCQNRPAKETYMSKQTCQKDLHLKTETYKRPTRQQRPTKETYMSKHNHKRDLHVIDLTRHCHQSCEGTLGLYGTIPLKTIWSRLPYVMVARWDFYGTIG